MSKPAKRKLWFGVYSEHHGELAVWLFEGPVDKAKAERQATADTEKAIGQKLLADEWVQVFEFYGIDEYKLVKVGGKR